MPRKVEISHKTIIFTVFFLLSLVFLFTIRDLILELFIALLITAILDPLVTKLSLYKIPRGVSVLISYVAIIGIFSGIVALLVPPLVEQSTNLASISPGFISKISSYPVVGVEVSQEVLAKVGTIPGELLKFGGELLSNLVSVFTVLVFAFYLLMSRNSLDGQLSKFFGDDKKAKIAGFLSKLEDRLGGWARGQFILMFTVGLMNYIGLTLLSVPFALPLAVLAGLLEVIPYIGPVIAAFPAILIGFGISGYTGVGVVAMALLVQQLENYVLVPKIMGKSVGISPIVIMLSLAVGQRMAGITGMIISIPIVIILQVFLSEYIFKER